VAFNNVAETLDDVWQQRVKLATADEEIRVGLKGVSARQVLKCQYSLDDGCGHSMFTKVHERLLQKGRHIVLIAACE
jgi:hypothetical protein